MNTYLGEKTRASMVPAKICCRYVLRHAEKEAPKTAIDTVVPHPLTTHGMFWTKDRMVPIMLQVPLKWMFGQMKRSGQIVTGKYCETARKDTVSNSSQGMVEGEIRLKKCSKNT